MYKMIVFDCDGTLVDSSAMIDMLYKGYHRMFPKRKKLPYEKFIPCYYMTDEENFTYLDVPLDAREKFERTCFQTDGNLCLDPLPFKGINEVLEQLMAYHYQIGVATSRNYQTFYELRNQIGEKVMKYISVVGVKEVVSHPKPAPDVLLYIMEQSKLKKEELLFIGDSRNDALCAAAAGVDFGWAKWGMVKYEEMPYTYVLETPKDLLAILFK